MPGLYGLLLTTLDLQRVLGSAKADRIDNVVMQCPCSRLA